MVTLLVCKFNLMCYQKTEVKKVKNFWGKPHFAPKKIQKGDAGQVVLRALNHHLHHQFIRDHTSMMSAYLGERGMRVKMYVSY